MTTRERLAALQHSGNPMQYSEACALYEILARQYRGRFALSLVRVAGGYVARSPWTGDRCERGDCAGNAWIYRRTDGWSPADHVSPYRSLALRRPLTGAQD